MVMMRMPAVMVPETAPQAIPPMRLGDPIQIAVGGDGLIDGDAEEGEGDGEGEGQAGSPGDVDEPLLVAGGAEDLVGDGSQRAKAMAPATRTQTMWSMAEKNPREPQMYASPATMKMTTML